MEVIVRIKGRMGNQMFEYACARSIQLNIPDSELVLDISDCFNNDVCPFTLNEAFKLSSKIRTIVGKYNEYSRQKNLFLKVGMKYFPKRLYELYAKRNVLLYDGEQYINLHYKQEDDIYLNGYFQSEKYFKNNSISILEDFSFARPPELQARFWQTKIENCQSVCIHIRLGDYLKSENKAYQVCNADYYLRGIKFLREKTLGKAVFFVFSDEIEKAKEMLPNNESSFEFVCTNLKNYQEFQLMTMCKHFIISNSSFSWWAQYLCKNEQKIVCAPAKWNKKNENRDIYLDNWILL